ncbi:MAG: excinuclease ABC subunit UvrC [Candidatus Dadabacteria bacterium]|nr:excinuclease ABC subunit UvrC [Candidatus Dadabacteria bacterium]
MSLSKEKVKSIPQSTGVYLLKDIKGRTVYIGKAKNLRSRVQSYIGRGESAQRPQIANLVNDIADVDYIVARDEREALVLENSLIKQKRPKYNIRLKDDKNYLSLRIDPRETFPRLSLTRRVLKDGAIYYGPFASAGALKKAKRFIHKIFPLRDCTDEKFRRHAARPCLNYYMGLCLGPCAGRSEQGRYREVVDQMRMFLKGEKGQIIKHIKESMQKASDEQRYEQAAKYRDQILLLEKNIDGQMFVTPGTQDKDVIGLHREGQRAEFSILFFRGGSLVDNSTYSIKNAVGEDQDVVEEFLERFYGGNRFVPKEIAVPLKLRRGKEISAWLSEKQGHKVRIHSPERGLKLKEIELANRNSLESFQRKYADELKEVSILERIRSSLHLRRLPDIIECFDISNIQGATAVASMVKFEGGQPAKGGYKRFKIKNVKGPNDYASMHEVLTRRLSRAEQDGWDVPDLILIDGGKGQLNIARLVMEEIGYADKVDLASIAKGKKEGEGDKLYVYGRKNPIIFSKNSDVLFLLMRVRDEAHRFAITYHKKLRGKKALVSELDGVPGIGAKRKKGLIRKFGTVSKIREATVNEIAMVPGLNKKLAEELKKHLSG